MRLYRNRQGLTKGKKGQAKAKKPKADPNHRTRPELAVELIKLRLLVPRRQLIVTGDSAYGGQSVLVTCPTTSTSSAMSIPRGLSTSRHRTRNEKAKGRARKKGDRLPGMKAWAEDPNQPWTELKFHQFGLHATLAIKTIQALYYKAGKDRLLTIVLVRDVKGRRPDQMFYCTKLDWTATDPLGIRVPLGDRMYI